MNIETFKISNIKTMADNQNRARAGRATGNVSSLKMKGKPKTQKRIKSMKSAINLESINKMKSKQFFMELNRVAIVK